jgi:hypothetical protein
MKLATYISLGAAQLLLGAALVSCADDDLAGLTTSATDEPWQLGATKQHLVTRTGDDVTYFKEGSDFRLFAVQHANTYDWTSARIWGKVGTADAGGGISYSTVAYNNRQDTLDFFAVAIDKEGTDSRYQFTAANLSSPGGTAPQVKWSSYNLTTEGTDNKLWRMGDLTYTNTVKGKTYRDGKIELPFKHALTRFTFEVSKVDEADYVIDETDFWLTQVRLVGIGVYNTHSEGTFDLCSASWTPSGSPLEMRCDSTLWIDASGKDTITTKATTVPDQLMLLPNGDEVLQMRVLLYFPQKPTTNGVSFLENAANVHIEGNDETGYYVNIITPLTQYELLEEGKATDNKAMKFESNCSYKFSIVLMRNDVRILVIAPTVYEWVEEDLEAENSVLGQPVTFGGLMWMDRNLGASSWDAATDFYGSIGYYYQYGRNIPYILDVEKFKFYADDDDVTTFNADNGAKGPAVVKATSTKLDYTDWKSPYYAWNLHGKIEKVKNDVDLQKKLQDYQVSCVYTYDHRGNKIVGYHQSVDGEVCPIRLVGDVVYNNDGTVDDETTSEYYKLCVMPSQGSTHMKWTVSTAEMLAWSSDIDAQPCPKGWRLPTKEDFYSFMPWTGITSQVTWKAYGGDFITNMQTGDTTKIYVIHYWDYVGEYNLPDVEYKDHDNPDTKTLTGYGNTWKGDGTKGWWREISGTGKYRGLTQQIRFGEKKTTLADGTIGTYQVAYLLNGVGSSTAYRIKIQTYFSEGSSNKRYLKISRYDADSDPDHGIDYYVQNGKDETEWDNPIETLLYPCAGFIVTDKDAFDLRSFGEGALVRTSEYYDNSWSIVQYMMTSSYNLGIHKSRMALADQLRCCRDITVTE